MKKILASLMCIAMVGVLSFGIAGCDNKPKETTVKFKDIPEQTAKKGADAKVSVELTEKAKVDITVTAKGKGEGDKITGTGTIKKDETKVELTLKSDKTGTFDVELTASGKDTKGTGSFKLKVTE